MPTDKGRSYQRERELIEAASLDAAIRMFINRWAPEGNGPRDFEADFIHIVQRIYTEAQKPFLSVYADVLVRSPMAPIIIDPKK